MKGIIAISGHQGLFKHIAEAKNHIIVESLDTGKRMPVYSTSKVSALDDIAIYTATGDVPLKDVLKAISAKENGGQTLNHKSSSNDLKSYFGEILPDYDRERVYVSDIKKVLMWYNILQEKEMLDFSEEEAPEKQENEPNEKESE